MEPYAAILPPLKKAIAVAVREAEKRVFRGDLQWQSSARWLESMRPARWRRTKRRETSQTQDIRFSWPDRATPRPATSPLGGRRLPMPCPPMTLLK